MTFEAERELGEAQRFPYGLPRITPAEFEKQRGLVPFKELLAGGPKLTPVGGRYPTPRELVEARVRNSAQPSLDAGGNGKAIGAGGKGCNAGGGWRDHADHAAGPAAAGGTAAAVPGQRGSATSQSARRVPAPAEPAELCGRRGDELWLQRTGDCGIWRHTCRSAASGNGSAKRSPTCGARRSGDPGKDSAAAPGCCANASCARCTGDPGDDCAAIGASASDNGFSASGRRAYTSGARRAGNPGEDSAAARGSAYASGNGCASVSGARRAGDPRENRAVDSPIQAVDGPSGLLDGCKAGQRVHDGPGSAVRRHHATKPRRGGGACGRAASLRMQRCGSLAITDSRL